MAPSMTRMRRAIARARGWSCQVRMPLIVASTAPRRAAARQIIADGAGPGTPESPVEAAPAAKRPYRCRTARRFFLRVGRPLAARHPAAVRRPPPRPIERNRHGYAPPFAPPGARRRRLLRRRAGGYRHL